MEIHPQVHCIATRLANCYLCLGQNNLALIDTLGPNQLDTIFNYIERIGRRPADLSRILITHADWDHAGSLAAIQSATGAVVYASAESINSLTSGAPPSHGPGWLSSLSRRFLRIEPVARDIVKGIEAGENLPVLSGLRVIATPGHTPDHTSFYSPTTGVLFAGDALSTRGGGIRLLPAMLTADREAARLSALTLLRLAPAVFACGHGTPLLTHTMDDTMALTRELLRD